MKKWINRVLIACLLVWNLVGGGLLPVLAEQTSESAYYYYYLNKDATQLEKKAYTPKSEQTEAMIEELALCIGSKKNEERVSNLLPQEVIIHTYKLQEKVLEIDFNGQYTQMSRTREVLVRAGIVKTFVQLPDVDAVRFTVSGEDLFDSKQQVIGEMSESTFVEYSGTQEQNNNNYRQEILTLYFTNAEGTGLVKEKRKVYYKPSLQKERVVLEQLFNGPMEKGNYPTVSDNVSVVSISTSEDICYVSLTQSFVDSALAIKGELAVYSIVNSLADSCGIERVELSVEGNTDVTFKDGISLYQFYEKNEAWILDEAVTDKKTES